MSNIETLKPGWYLLKTKVREEVRAVDNLENQEFEAYCPQYLEKAKLTPLFPGYMFVKLCDEDIERYHKIRSTRGVSAIVAFNKMHQKKFNEGRGSNCKNALQEMLPQPIPGGNKIIDQIEEIIWVLDGYKPEAKPASVVYAEGDKACHKNALYKHLEFTFLNNAKSERGLFLVQYIKSMRSEDGIEEKIISERKMEIPFVELEKA